MFPVRGQQHANASPWQEARVLDLGQACRIARARRKASAFVGNNYIGREIAGFDASRVANTEQPVLVPLADNDHHNEPQTGQALPSLNGSRSSMMRVKDRQPAPRASL
jgi:hypothetical protein